MEIHGIFKIFKILDQSSLSLQQEKIRFCYGSPKVYYVNVTQTAWEHGRREVGSEITTKYFPHGQTPLEQHQSTC